MYVASQIFSDSLLVVRQTVIYLVWMLQREHSALLLKLEFICDLVHCIVSVAEERSSPLAQSVIIDRSSPGHRDIIFADELQRCIEQLVLYVRALHLLASGLQLAQGAIKNGQLERSKTASRSEYEYHLGHYLTDFQRTVIVVWFLVLPFCHFSSASEAVLRQIGLIGWLSKF